MVHKRELLAHRPSQYGVCQRNLTRHLFLLYLAMCERSAAGRMPWSNLDVEILSVRVEGVRRIWNVQILHRIGPSFESVNTPMSLRNTCTRT